MGPWERVDPGSGFGDSSNRAIFAMAVCGDYLYVSASWNSTSNNGFEVWRYDGSNWARVNVDGFDGNSDNWSVRSLQVWNNRLYAGVYNDDDGCQVWEYDGSSWTQVAQDGFGISF